MGSTYENNVRNKQMEEQAGMILSRVSKLASEIPTHPDSITGMMNLIEKIIQSCGGEKSVMFHEVSTELIKVHTRLPMEYNLLPMVPAEYPGNTRVNKIVTTMLLIHPRVKGVRWIPCIETRGSYIIVDLKKGDINVCTTQ